MKVMLERNKAGLSRIDRAASSFGAEVGGSAYGADVSASDFILLFDRFAPFSVCFLKLFGKPEILLRDSSLIMS